MPFVTPTTSSYPNIQMVLTDPTTITLKWKPSGGSTTTWVYPTGGGQITKLKVGVYKASISTTSVSVTGPTPVTVEVLAKGACAVVKSVTFTVVADTI